MAVVVGMDDIAVQGVPVRGKPLSRSSHSLEIGPGIPIPPSPTPTPPIEIQPSLWLASALHAIDLHFSVCENPLTRLLLLSWRGYSRQCSLAL